MPPESRPPYASSMTALNVAGSTPASIANLANARAIDVVITPP